MNERPTRADAVNTLEFLKSMLKDKQKQIHDEPDCELWDDEEWQLKKVIELVEMEITEEEEEEYDEEEEARAYEGGKEDYLYDNYVAEQLEREE